MSAVADLLERAMARIATPKTWTQGAAARDMYGVELLAETDIDLAACFCAAGALRVVSKWNGASAVKRFAADALNLEARAMGCAPSKDADGNESEEAFVVFNDTHTHAEVIEMYRRAIAAERAKEGATS